MLHDKYILGGKLVGIGKIHTDGSEDYQELAKPVGNKIVSQGLDQLFLLNGTQSTEYTFGEQYTWVTLGFQGDYIPQQAMWADSGYYSWYYNGATHYVSTSPSRPTGVLEWVRYGTGTSSTRFDSTDLENPVSSFYHTKKTGWPLCGTRMVQYGTYRMHITHVSPAAEDNVSVSEIEWYTRYGTNGSGSNIPEDYLGDTYKMFSRIKLPSAYTLYKGEQLITTYELVLSFDCVEPTVLDSFFGLTDVDGNTLKGECFRTIYSSGSEFGFPYINDSGNGAHHKHNSYIPVMLSPRVSKFCNPEGTSYPAYKDSLHFFYSDATTQRNFPAQNAYDTNLLHDDTVARETITYADYVPGTFYRDVRVTVPHLCPNMSDLDNEYKDINYINMMGLAVRFGYYDSDNNWVPQAFRKYANRVLKLSFRTSFSTVDTV